MTQQKSKVGVEYVRGGRCPVHQLIEVPEGYPKCPDHPIWLGVFEGSWYDIGRQYGASEGVRTYITNVFDYWFGLVRAGSGYVRSNALSGSSELRAAAKGFTLEKIKSTLQTLEEQVNLYEPNFMAAMEGIEETTLTVTSYVPSVEIRRER